jgi:hypothetical protein
MSRTTLELEIRRDGVHQLQSRGRVQRHRVQTVVRQRRGHRGRRYRLVSQSGFDASASLGYQNEAHIPDGETAIWAAHDALTVAHGPESLVVVVVDAAIQLQALEMRAAGAPTAFDTQAAAAYDGMAVAATTPPSVKEAQKDLADSRRPGVCAALMARRQLSALQSAAARGAARARRVRGRERCILQDRCNRRNSQEIID